MAHPLRLKILCALKGDELPVLEIVKYVGSSQSNKKTCHVPDFPI
jgi:ArsR family transcriptional regulator